MQSANRAFEASVQVRGRPVKEVHHRGRTYIEGRQGTEYTLHFRNNENRRVLVIPSVDGLSVVDGKPAGRNSAGFIVERYSSIDIPGWMVDPSTAAKFVFWPQDARGESTYVEELTKSGANVDPGNQGLIGFLVLEEHFTPTLRLDGYHSPADRNTWGAVGFNDANHMTRGLTASSSGVMLQNNISANGSLGVRNAEDYASSQAYWTAEPAGMGTKFGEATNFNTVTGEFKRGRTLGEFVIEYDTLRGLKDRGVPTHLFTGSEKLYGQRSAFPANQAGCEPPAGWKR